MASKTTKKAKPAAKKATVKKAVKKAPAKKVVKKVVAKKVVKKVAAKKAAPVAKKRLAPIKEAMTKTALTKSIVEATEVSKSDVTAVLEELSKLIERHISSKVAIGSFTLPGLLKITCVSKPAKKARKGINPFTGEETMFKAKPAHRVLKIRALKKMKDMVS